MKKIVIFGSTGSIGSSLLKIIKDDPKNFKIGTFITAPPIPIGAEIKPTINPKIIFKCNLILIM